MVEVDSYPGLTVLGVGVVQQGKDYVTVPLSQAMQIGQIYVTRRLGHTGSLEYAKFECVRRYGFSESLSDGTAVDSIYQRSAVVGDQDFAINLNLENEGVSADKRVQGLMGVGVRVNGVDPVIDLGFNFLLNTTVFLPADGYLDKASGFGLVQTAIGIPNDPSLAGSVFLVQFGLDDGGTLRLSEIYGGYVHAAGGAASSSGGGKSFTQAWYELVRNTGRAVFDGSIAGAILQQRGK